MKLASACLLLASSASAFVPAQRRAFVATQPLSAKAYEAVEIDSIVSTLPHLDANEKANLKNLLFKAGEVEVPPAAEETVAVALSEDVSEESAPETVEVSLKNEEEESVRGEDSSSIEISSNESNEAPVVVDEKKADVAPEAASETTIPKESSSVSGESSLEVASTSSEASSETIVQQAAKQQDEVVTSVLPSTVAESAPVDAAVASGGDAVSNVVTEVLNSHSELVEGVVNTLSQL